MEKENTFFQDYTKLMNSFEVMKKEASNPFFKSKYVTLNQILPVVKQKCTENNFVLMQKLDGCDGKNYLLTTLRHKDGGKLTGSMEIISKDVNDPQKVGAGITYMRRYSLVTMFMLEDEDDDGNTASAPQALNKATGTPPQAPKPIVNQTPPTQQTPPPQPEYVPVGTMTTKDAVNNLNGYKKPVVGETCPMCNKGKMVLNPKTQKVFCEEKCWLNK